MAWYITVPAAIVATFGFAVLYNVEWKKLSAATIGGGLAWVAYLLGGLLSPHMFVMALIGGFIGTVYSEGAACVFRTPATVFIIPAIIPLVPGSSLYYGMSNLIGNNYTEALTHFGNTAYVILGVACGVVAASLIVNGFKAVRAKRK